MGCVEQSGGKECDKLVERLVDKYHLFKKLVDHAFQGDHRFQLAMKEAFEISQHRCDNPASHRWQGQCQNDGDL